MKMHRVAACAAFCLAATSGVAASALEGAFEAPSGTKAMFSASAARVELPDGTTFDVPVMTEGNMIVFAADADDPTCPGQTGTYTVSETEDGVTFTAQSDACDIRKEDLTAGAWTRTEAETE